MTETYATPTVHRDDRGRLSLDWPGDERFALCAREIVEQFITATNDAASMREALDVMTAGVRYAIALLDSGETYDVRPILKRALEASPSNAALDDAETFLSPPADREAHP